MMDEKRIADYFVIAGVPDLPRTFDPAQRSTPDPITDITVIIRSNHEPIPKGYVCIEKTPTGEDADLNHGSIRSPSIFLCYRRGRDKPPLADIGVYYMEGKEQLISNCSMVKKTPSMFSANVNNSGTQTYLTYRRSAPNAPCNQLVVTDICVILPSKGETPPHAFCLIEKNLNKGIIGSDVFLCYKKSMDRPPSLSYNPVIIDRFPLDDHPQYSLPEYVPMFCLPMGASIECWPKVAQRPHPSFSTFILTTDSAEKIYGSLLNFYETIQPNQLTIEELKQLKYVDCGDQLNSDQSSNDNSSTIHISNTKTLHRIKSICILSHWPFFDQFKRFLIFLYNSFIMSSTTPLTKSLESYIFYFMNDILFPSPERPDIMVNLSTSSDETILFSQTFDDLPIPSNGASFKKMLLNLGPENCIVLLLFALTEQKILLHSLRPSVLTEVAEAITTIIFPLNWHCPYIPMCPISLSGVLNAPLPFIVGIDSRYFDCYIEAPFDVASIDIDTKAIFLNDSKRHLDLKLLPKKAMRFLKLRLENIYERIRSSNQLKSNMDANAKKKFDKEIETEIQEAFLHFMALILRDFRNFLKPITAAPKVGATDPSSLFDFDGFLRSRESASIPFYKLLVHTQMFTKFIEERSLVSDKNVSLAFFDECIEKIERHEKLGLKQQSSVHLNLIDFEDRSKSNKTVFLSIPDSPVNAEEKFTYQYFGPLNRQIFYRLKGEHCSSRNSFQLDPISHTSTVQPTTVTDYSGSSLALNSELHSYMFAKRAKHEIRKAQKSAIQASQSPVEWAKYLLFNSYCLWFTHFPAFSNVLQNLSNSSTTTNDEDDNSANSNDQFNDQQQCHQLKPLSIAYEVLQRMQTMQFSTSDEFCYRILMIMCGIHSQPALAVKVFLDMQKYQIRLNAITYGYYNKAVLEGNWPTEFKNAKWVKLRNTMRVVLHFKRHIKCPVSQQPEAKDDSSKTTSITNHSDSVDLNCSTGASQNQPINQPALLVDYSKSAGILMLSSSAINHQQQSLKSVDLESLRKRHKSSGSQPSKNDSGQTEIAQMYQDFKNVHSINAMSIQVQDSNHLVDPLSQGDNDSVSNCSRNEVIGSKEMFNTTTTPEPSVRESSDENLYDNDSFSSRFTTPIKEVMNSLELFSPKSNFASSLRSSFRMAKTFTKSSKYGFSRNSPFHNSDKSLNKSGNSTSNSTLFGKPVVDSAKSLPRSSTLPQSFQTAELNATTISTAPIQSEPVLKSTLSNNSVSGTITPTTNNASGSPWANKLGSGKHSEYVYSTFKLAANRINELKSSLTSNSSSSNTASPVKLNMANVMASGNYLISQFRNLAFDDNDDSANDDRTSLDTFNLTYEYNERNCNLESYSTLFETLNQYYSCELESYELAIDDSGGSSSSSKSVPTTSQVDQCPNDTSDNTKVVLKVQIVTCSICRLCNSIVYDEEIMCRWSADDSNLNTKCIFCKATFVPSLTIYLMDSRRSENLEQFVQLDPISVPYLSPLVLRKELETILNSEGYSSLTRPKFVDDHPIVYWNLLCYFDRLNLPSHLPALALTATTLNSNEIIQINEKRGYNFRNISICCFWDNDKFYDTTPIHKQWLKLKNIDDSKKTDTWKNMTTIFLELVDLIENKDLAKPIQYLISERSKTKSSGNQQQPQRFNSIYRELLFLSLIEIHKADFNSDKFDAEYSEAYESLSQKDKESLRKTDNPPPIGAIFCRNLFKQLALH